MYPELEDILELRRMAGLEGDPRLGRLIEQAIKRGDRAMLAKILKRLRFIVAPLLARGDSFVIPTEAMLGSEGIPIARDPHSGQWLKWAGYFKGVFINGAQGGGKTNFALNLIERLYREAGIRCWVYDRRADYAAPLLRAIPETTVIFEDQWRDNVLLAPAGVPVKVWDQAWVQYSAHVFGLKMGGETFLHGVLANLRNKTAGRTITLTNLVNELSDLKHLSYDEKGYRDRALSRFKALIALAGENYDVRQGYFDALHQSEAPAVFVLRGSHFLYDYLVTTLAWRTYHARLANPGKAKPLLFVLDEARQLIRESCIKKDDNAQDIDELGTRLRPLVAGLIVIEQMSEEVSKALISNSELKVLFNNQPNDAFWASRYTGLSRQQFEQIPKLDPLKGECVVRMSSARTPYPLKANVPLFAWPTTPEEPAVLREMARPGLERLRSMVPEEPEDWLSRQLRIGHVQNAEESAAAHEASAAARLSQNASGDNGTSGELRREKPPAEQRRPPRTDGQEVPLTEDELTLLLEINERPLLCDAERGWEANRLRRAKAGLAGMGLITVVACNDGSHRGTLRLPQLTAAGAQAIEQLGHEVQAPRNWIAHRYLADRLEQSLAAQGIRVLAKEFHEANGNITDLVIALDGVNMPIELHNTGSWQAAHEHLKRLVEIYDRILLVASGKLLRQIRSGLRRNLAKDEWGRIQSKVLFCELGDVGSRITGILSNSSSNETGKL